jgi:hypothetical protein
LNTGMSGMRSLRWYREITFRFLIQRVLDVVTPRPLESRGVYDGCSAAQHHCIFQRVETSL